MAEGNGDGIPLVVLGKRGRLRVQYDAKSPEVTIDVMVAASQWAEIDASFRDEKNEIPADKVAVLQQAAVDWVRGLLGIPAEVDVSWAEANHFVAVITAESKKLKDFFDSVSGVAPSSRASTELTFSTGPVDLG